MTIQSFLRTSLRTSAVFMFIVIGVFSQAVHASEARASGAHVSVNPVGDIVIHTFMAPYDRFAITTYIIESDNALVLIDGQMFTPLAEDYRAYADSLGKPIDRLIVTHGHPDHYLGLVAFEDVPIFALPDTIAEIEETGEQTRVARTQMMGEIVPGRVVAPTHELTEGDMTIDGVRYNVSAISDSEHSPMVITRLPDHGVISVGDTAMAGVHLFLTSDFLPWAEQLRILSKDTDYRVVLTGHGGTGDQNVYATNIAYLEKADSLIKTGANADSFKTDMVASFPKLKMPSALDFFLPYLFPEKK